MKNFERPYIAITDAVASHARWYPSRTALVCGEHRLTWRGLNDEANRTANGLLARGLRRGDKVGLLMGNSAEWVEAMLGTVKAGGVVVPLSPMLTPEGLRGMVSDSGARFFFADAGSRDAGTVRERFGSVADNGFFSVGFEVEGWTSHEVMKREASPEEPQVRLALDDDFNIIYSSGTTGRPKGIVHTHYTRQQFAFLLGLEFRVTTASTVVLTTPLYSNGTWMLLLPALMLGATTVVMEKFDPGGFLSLVEEERATHTFMVPPQYGAILSLPDFGEYDRSSMQVLVSAGAPLNARLKGEILDRFGTGLLELYGLTEGVATTLKPEVVSEKIASVGTPMFGCDVRIVDDAGREFPRGEAGEIVGYSTAMMRGYHNRPEDTAATVWTDEVGRTYVKTEDVGRLDEGGYLYVLDRKKDMIVSGGFNVYSSDVEEVFRGHPEVADVAVIGVPHERRGETPLALVVRAEGCAITEDGFAVWANGRLAKHQRVGEGRVSRGDTARPPSGQGPEEGAPGAVLGG